MIFCVYNLRIIEAFSGSTKYCKIFRIDTLKVPKKSEKHLGFEAICLY